MSQDINSVVIVGRLTRDAELKYLPTGTAVLNFGLAVNRRVKQGEAWADEPSFFDVTLFGKLGEAIKQYMSKGGQVAVAGSLRQDRWEKDGVKHSRVNIVAETVQLVGGRRGDTAPADHQGAPQPSAAGHEQFEDDIPF